MDDVTFLGDNIPSEVLRILPTLTLISQKSAHFIIPLSMDYFVTPQTTALPDSQNIDEWNQKLENEVKQGLEEVNKPKSKKKMTKGELEQVKYCQQHGIFSVLFTGFYIIARAAFRLHLKDDVFKDQLSKMQLSDDIVKKVIEKYQQRKPEFERLSQDTSVQQWYHHIVEVRWRVDVTISSSSMNRVFKPVLLMQFELSNGRVAMFEVSLKQFHELRLSVASVLNDMYSLEKHRIMAIQEK